MLDFLARFSTDDAHGNLYKIFRKCLLDAFQIKAFESQLKQIHKNRKIQRIQASFQNKSNKNAKNLLHIFQSPPHHIAPTHFQSFCSRNLTLYSIQHGKSVALAILFPLFNEFSIFTV